jgi:hypothetical protein
MGHSGRVAVTPPPGGPGAGTAAAAPRPPWRVAAFVVAVVAVVVLTIVLAAAARNRGQDPTATRNVSVAADGVRTVDIQAPPGHLAITAVRTGRVILSGPVHWTGRSAVLVTGPRITGGVLHLSYRCATHSPCTARLRLVVPQHCGVALRQPSGHVTMSGLAGPLWISARSVDISAAGLRSPTLAATITAGHLSAAFATPPQRVNLTLVSAQATLHLPASVTYRLSQQVTSGYVHAGIPQASDSARTITTRIDSGELELLPG